MPQYTVTAFRWSGTGYNALYNTSYAVIIDDDDPNLDGSSDANETFSINGGAFTTSAGPPYDINVSFTDVNGDPHVETFFFFNTAGSWYFIPGPGSEFTVGATLGNYQSHTTTSTSYSTITCFVQGTLIETDKGAMPVEYLKKGDRVRTTNGKYEALRLPLSRKISAKNMRLNSQMAPVRIMAGALGNGKPERDLLVSRQHRMLVSSKICERMFGNSNILVAAIKLTALPGIFVDTSQREVEYFHLLFDKHEVIFAEGSPTESFYLGQEALGSLPEASREEILSIFPSLNRANFTPKSAFQIPSGKLQKKLVSRHLKNSRPLQ